MLSSRDLPDPRIEPRSPEAPALQADSLPPSHWKSLDLFLHLLNLFSGGPILDIQQRNLINDYIPEWGSLSFFQKILPTQKLNPGLLHSRWTLLFEPPEKPHILVIM